MHSYSLSFLLAALKLPRHVFLMADRNSVKEFTVTLYDDEYYVVKEVFQEYPLRYENFHVDIRDYFSVTS
jgi:hypothetical protein